MVGAAVEEAGAHDGAHQEDQEGTDDGGNDHLGGEGGTEGGGQGAGQGAAREHDEDEIDGRHLDRGRAAGCCTRRWRAGSRRASRGCALT